MASYITLVSTVLVYCLTVSASHASTDCASHEADIVLLTADQLREEMKCQLDEALAEAYQALYNNVTQYISLKHNDTMAALAEINGRIPSIGEIREVYNQSCAIWLYFQSPCLNWPQTPPQDSTGSEVRLNKCIVTWRGAAMVWVEAGWEWPLST